MIVTSAEEAVSVIRDGWCVVPGGFGSGGHPDSLTGALRKRFLATGAPRNLSLLFGAGPGDKCGRGADALALPGLVSRVIGGFWGLCPELAAMARQGQIEAHNWPQGVISKLFAAAAGGGPGVVTSVGLGTFVDPLSDGGVIDTIGSRPLVQRVNLQGRDYLFYPSQPVNCALLRGTVSDARGNVAFFDETSDMDALAQAQAARNAGGVVIVQVKRIVDNLSIPPRQVQLPGFLVDYVVIASEKDHPQTYGTQFNAAYTSTNAPIASGRQVDVPLAKRIIAQRAARELASFDGASINLGIGIPSLVGHEAKRLGIEGCTLTVESGVIGGTPDSAMSFGASMNPQAIIEQSSLFDFYDGGGIDIAFLGFGEVDQYGNVNVSRLGGVTPGAGGFINISQAAKRLIFCGTLTTRGLSVSFSEGALVVSNEGSVQKFVPRVSHMTFNGQSAGRAGKEVMFITERAVFALRDWGLLLTELAPGISVESLRRAVGCEFGVSDDLRPISGYFDTGVTAE